MLEFIIAILILRAIFRPRFYRPFMGGMFFPGPHCHHHHHPPMGGFGPHGPGRW